MCIRDRGSSNREFFGIKSVVLDCVKDWEVGYIVVVDVYWLKVEYLLGHEGVQQCGLEGGRSWPGNADGPRPSVTD